MAYLRKHREKWQAQIERNGKRTSKTFQTKREAQAWATAEEGRAARQKAGGSYTFGDATDRYEREVSPRKETAEQEGRRLRRLESDFGLKTLLVEIDAPQVAEWRDARLKTVSGSTVVREANLLRNLFRVAKDEWRWMEHYPFQGVKLPAENAPRVDRIWPWRLIRRVLRAPRIGKTAEMQDAFHIALRTGMRLSEVLRAPEAFDPKRSVVTLKTKTEARAVIPIGRHAAKLLVRPAFTVGPNEGSVLFSKLCRELLIDDLTFHDARATALTHLARKVDVLQLAKISRHKNISILSNVYYRERPEDIAKRI